MDLERLLSRLKHQPAVLVTVHSVQGSGPREVGAWMAVFLSKGRSRDEKGAPLGGNESCEAEQCGGVSSLSKGRSREGEVCDATPLSDVLIGSVGGGHLEWQAIAIAQEAMARGTQPFDVVRRFPLGPALGQCCGGVVELRFERIELRDRTMLQDRLRVPSKPLALFGGGHVGKALIKCLEDLPFSIAWIDSRDEIFPENLPQNVRTEYSDPVQAAVGDLEAGSSVLIMSFSHAEDLDVVAACLMRQRTRGDLAYIGLIGSKTKWAKFKHRLAERGFTPEELAGVTCPIGVPGIEGKAPAVVAVAVAAQLLGVLGL